MIIRTRAYGRAGLIGNPSDGYFGKTISLLIRNFYAQVTCWESPSLSILPQRSDRLDFDSLDALVDDVRLNGYYGGIRLIKATIKRFHDYCQETGIHLDDRNFTIAYQSSIPVRVGLAGSSGIVTATLRALMSFYGVELPLHIQPNVILSVELEELGIGAGLQDRVIQVYEGVVYMNFNKQLMERQGYGEYVPLSSQSLPPLFVAYHSDLAEGTEVTHNDLRSRFNRGDGEVIGAMKEFADYAEQARQLLQSGRGSEIAALMDQNFELRKRLCHITPGNQQMVDIGKSEGASVKFAGSGGAVVGVYDGDPQRLARLKDKYEAMGATLIQPRIQPSESHG